MLMFIFPLLPFFRTASPKEEPKVGKHFSATISVCLSALKEKGMSLACLLSGSQLFQVVFLLQP